MKGTDQLSTEAQSAYAFWEALQEFSDQLWDLYETEFVAFIQLEQSQEEYLEQEPPFPEDPDEDDIPF